MDVYPYAKFSVIAQFSLNILQIQYWESLLACPSVPLPPHPYEWTESNKMYSYFFVCYLAAPWPVSGYYQGGGLKF